MFFIVNIMNDKRFKMISKPYSPKNVIIKRDRGTYLFLDPDTPNWVVVNAIGRDILEFCDGKHTIKEITEILCEKYNEPYEESAENVLSFLNKLREKKFLQEVPFLIPVRLDKKNVSLMDVWVHVTNKCNLSCIHCHLDSGTPFRNEMTKEEIFGVIDRAMELGMKKLVVSGGEPFIRSDILDIIKYAHKRNVRIIRIITNGTLITEKIARTLRKLDVNVQVSLDGAYKETHDSIRGGGTYKKTINGIKNLMNKNTDCYVCMTLMKRNVNEMQEMANLLENLGVRALHFSALQNKGRAEKNNNNYTNFSESGYHVLLCHLQV